MHSPIHSSAHPIGIFIHSYEHYVGGKTGAAKRGQATPAKRGQATQSPISPIVTIRRNLRAFICMYLAMNPGNLLWEIGDCVACPRFAGVACPPFTALPQIFLLTLR
jgi:hypothetical protein